MSGALLAFFKNSRTVARSEFALLHTLNKLFVVKNNLELNPDILAKGVRGIEEVASETRDLLAKYYSNE